MTDYRDTIAKRRRARQTGFLDGLKEAGGDFAEGAKNFGEDVVEGGGQALDEGVSAVTNTADDAGESFGNFVEDTTSSGGVAGQTADFFGGGVDAIAGGGEDIAEGAADFVGGEGTFEDVTSGIDDTFEGATNSFEDVTSGIDDTFEGVTEGAGDAISDVTGGAGDALDNAIGGVEDTFGDIGSGVTEGVSDFTDSALGGATSVVSGATDTIGDITGGAMEGIEDIGGGAVDAATDFGSSLGDLGGDLIGGTTDVGGDLLGGATDIGGDLLGGAGDALGGTVDFGSDVVGGGIDLGADLGGAAVDAATGDGQNKQGNQVQWGEPQKVEQMGRCIIQKQSSNQGDERFLVVTANSNNEEVFLDSSGNMVKVSNVEGMDDIPFHDTLSAARSACEAADMDRAWGQLEQYEEHDGGVIMVQSSQSGDERYFALTTDQNGNNAAVATDGSLVQMEEGDKGDDLPSYPTPESAREALNKATTASRQWGDLEKVETTGQCVIMRQRSSDENERFFTLTKGQNGELVAVSNDGKGVVVSSVDNAQQLPHYPTIEDARAACPSTEGQPSQGGDRGGTDDSTSSDGPTSGQPPGETTEVSEDEDGTPPEVSGDDVPTSSGGAGGQPAQSGMMGGLMDMDIAGIPLPLAAAGGAGAIGLATMVLGDDKGMKNKDDSKLSADNKRLRKNQKKNVNKRSSADKQQRRSKNNGQKNGSKKGGK